MTDKITWTLNGSNGTVNVLDDVSLTRDHVDIVADCCDPSRVSRIYDGPLRVSAIVAGTGEDG